VLDPFCGRGTTNFAARLLGLPSVGIDSNPVAAAIAAAKIAATTPAAVLRACRRILDSGHEPRDTPAGEFWELCFEKTTLWQICALRESLLEDCRSEARKVLRALLLGRLHGPRNKGDPSYLSNQMPRTYAAKPGYAVRFWRKRRLEPPRVDVVDLVQRQATWYLSSMPPGGPGEIQCADVRHHGVPTSIPPVRWVVTSPPYYGLRTYVPDQWLRYWFLGGPPHVEYRQNGQLSHGSPEDFSAQLALVWRRVAEACGEGARLVVRFGGIHDRNACPRSILLRSMRAADRGWRALTAVSAGRSTAGKRQAGQFGRELRRPIEEYDFHAVLAR
jgi:hypothetical protein